MEEVVARSAHRARRLRIAIYAGGFLGPFGANVIVTLIPELRHALGASNAEVTAGITAYLLPFALLQVVSGTVGERLGIGRTIRCAYLVYAAVSVLGAFSPTIAVFLVCRAMQGVANAFVSPLLLAALATMGPAHKLGRAVGTFTAIQTAALVAGPFVGGVAGAVDWRIAFVLPACVGLLLTMLPVPPRSQRAESARWTAALTVRVGRLSVAGFVAALAIPGLAVIVALRVSDAFQLNAIPRGLAVAGFGLAGVATGWLGGALGDRIGAGKAVTLGAVTAFGAELVLAAAHTTGMAVAGWMLAGAGAAFIWAGLGSMAVTAVPSNRAGAASLYSAFRFAGSGVAPLLWLPLYQFDPILPFLLASLLTLVVAIISFSGR